MAPAALITPAETRAVLERVDELLGSLNEGVARIAILGELNDAQIARLEWCWATIDGLRALFAAERARLGGAASTVRLES